MSIYCRYLVNAQGPRLATAILLAAVFSIFPFDSGTEPAHAAVLSPAFSQPRIQEVPSEWSSMTIRETFNDLGNGNVNTPLETAIGTFTRVGTAQVANGEQWGGANGSKYLQIGGTGSLTLSLSSATNFRYIGFWWSAGNPGNRICLQDATQTGTSGTACLAEYSTSDLLASSSFNEALYRGNPNLFAADQQVPGNSSPTAAQRCVEAEGEDGHCGEPFAFIHAFYDDGFAKVTFSGNGFELDNITASTEESTTLLDALPSGTLIGADSLPAYSLTAARVIPVDPRSQSVPFPGVVLGGAAASQPNATLCFTQVTNAAGTTPVPAASSNLQLSMPSISGITRNFTAPRFTVTGSQSTVRSAVSEVRILSSSVNRSVASSESVWFRVSIQARFNTSTSCQSSNNVITSVVVELRPIRLNNVNQLGIPLD